MKLVRSGSRLFVLLSLLFVSVFLLPPTSIYAQAKPALAISLSPSVVELALQPGKTITQAFLIKNEGQMNLQVTPQLRDFQFGDLNGLPDLLPDSQFPYATLANSEIHFGEPFVLAAGASEQFILQIAVPESAAEKDWYFSVLAVTQPAPGQLVQQSGSGATAQGTIGAHVLVRITKSNQVPLDWQIELPLPRFIDSLQKIEFQPIVKNNSATYATPKLTVTVLDWRQNIISEQENLPERILSQSQRVALAAQPTKEDPRSLEGVPFQLAPRFALGPYTVRASIASNTGSPTIVEQRVIAFPFSLLTAILAVVILRILIGRYRRQRMVETLE